MNRSLSVIGVPTALGQMKKGVDLGPSAIRHAGLIERLTALGYDPLDCGDLSVRHSSRQSPEENPRNLQAVADISERLAETVDREMKKGRFPLVLGGDHSTAIGTVAGAAKNGRPLGVIWVDAHGDLNTTETSPSGNIHGMPLAASLGLGDKRLVEIGGLYPKIKPENVVIIGARDLDDGEKQLIGRLQLKVYTMRDIEKTGIAAVMSSAIRDLKARTSAVHLSLDLDSLDPFEAPGVGTPVRGGLAFRELSDAMASLHEADFLVSAEFVEVNPLLDDRNRTAQTAVGLAEVLFGKRIL